MAKQSWSLMALLSMLAALPAAAQTDFPTKPLRLLVGFPPGGSTDVLGRTLAQEVRGLLGQDVIIINKPGASGYLAIADVAASPADGYTIGITPSSAMTLAHHFQSIRSDLLEATTGLVMVGRQRIGLTVKADSPFRTLQDLVEHARANPGKVSVGIPGAGTLTELITRMIIHREGLEVNVVPMQGDAPVATALLGGHITAGSSAAGGWTPHVREGTMRLLVSQEAERAEVAPDAPSILELGYTVAGGGIQFMYAPKGLPAAVRARLIEAFGAAARSPAYVDIAMKNTLYDKQQLAGDALDQSLLQARDEYAALVERLGLKKR